MYPIHPRIFLIISIRELMAHGPTEVLPHLFVGDKDSAQNFKAIDMLGIECIQLYYYLLSNR